MDGEPADVDGECNARLFIGDNYGDGTATMRCQRAPGHEGLHQEQFKRTGGPVTITWTGDERQKCDHGCGQWAHQHSDDHERAQCPKYQDDHVWSTCPHCHPDETPETCAACGKPHYAAWDHADHCTAHLPAEVS